MKWFFSLKYDNISLNVKNILSKHFFTTYFTGLKSNEFINCDTPQSSFLSLSLSTNDLFIWFFPYITELIFAFNKEIVIPLCFVISLRICSI